MPPDEVVRRIGPPIGSHPPTLLFPSVDVWETEGVQELVVEAVAGRPLSNTDGPSTTP